MLPSVFSIQGDDNYFLTCLLAQGAAHIVQISKQIVRGGLPAQARIFETNPVRED